MVFWVGLNSSVMFAVSVDSAQGRKSALAYDTDDSKSLTLAGQNKTAADVKRINRCKQTPPEPNIEHLLS